jgi:hypothetical protein
MAVIMFGISFGFGAFEARYQIGLHGSAEVYFHEMETSPQKIKMYSMHVGNHTVKIKTYTIFLISHAGDKKGQLHIERKVTNTLFLDKEKKWTIDQDLRNIVVQGVRKRCYALRHIQKYYDAIN